jgi:hypothetical protein
MDGNHAGIEPRFRQATTVLTTIISPRPDRIVTDTGKKTVGATQAVLKDYDYPVFRYDGGMRSSTSTIRAPSRSATPWSCSLGTRRSL